MSAKHFKIFKIKLKNYVLQQPIKTLDVTNYKNYNIMYFLLYKMFFLVFEIGDNQLVNWVNLIIKWYYVIKQNIFQLVDLSVCRSVGNVSICCYIQWFFKIKLKLHTLLYCFLIFILNLINFICRGKGIFYLPSPKIAKNLPRTNEKLHFKEETY